jgi:hypothetical protein
MIIAHWQARSLHPAARLIAGERTSNRAGAAGDRSSPASVPVTVHSQFGYQDSRVAHGRLHTHALGFTRTGGGS